MNRQDHQRLAAPIIAAGIAAVLFSSTELPLEMLGSEFNLSASRFSAIRNLIINVRTFLVVLMFVYCFFVTVRRSRNPARHRYFELVAVGFDIVVICFVSQLLSRDVLVPLKIFEIVTGEEKISEEIAEVEPAYRYSGRQAHLITTGTMPMTLCIVFCCV